MNALQYMQSALVGTFNENVLYPVRNSRSRSPPDSVSDLRVTVEEVWNNPMLSAHLQHTHTTAVSALHGQAGGPASKSRKRKHLPDPEVVEAQSEVRALQQKLDAISLQCWGYDSHAVRFSAETHGDLTHRLSKESAFFMRASKHSDFNALKNVKKSGHGTLACNQLSPRLTGTDSGSSPALIERSSHRDALVTLAVFNRIPYIHSQLTRSSQHVLLSSQTLADFVGVIPCNSSDMPAEVVGNQGNVVGYTYESEEQGPESFEQGCLLLIEGVVYGDGRQENDYAEYVQPLPQSLMISTF